MEFVTEILSWSKFGHGGSFRGGRDGTRNYEIYREIKPILIKRATFLKREKGSSCILVSVGQTSGEDFYIPFQTKTLPFNIPFQTKNLTHFTRLLWGLKDGGRGIALSFLEDMQNINRTNILRHLKVESISNVSQWVVHLLCWSGRITKRRCVNG